MVDFSKSLLSGINFCAMSGKQLCNARNAAFGDLPLVQLPVVVLPAVWGSNQRPRRA
jgi:hypothetical protein